MLDKGIFKRDIVNDTTCMFDFRSAGKRWDYRYIGIGYLDKYSTVYHTNPHVLLSIYLCFEI